MMKIKLIMTLSKYNLNIMDSGFPKNITFEILYFLEWEEFYKILQHNGLNIQEQLKIYVKCNNSLNDLTIDKVCEK